MATDTSDTGIGLGDARLQIGLGLLLTLAGFVGLSGVLPLPLNEWASWYLFTGLFFGGVVVTLFAVRAN